MMVVSIKGTDGLFQRSGTNEQIGIEKRGVRMVKTCANPVCGAPFHYWRGGRLFRCDVRTPYEPCLDVPDPYLPAEAEQEFRIFLAVRKLLFNYDSALRSAYGA